MLNIKQYKFWFCPCTQDLYGDEVLAHVAAHAGEVVAHLNASKEIPFEVMKPAKPAPAPKPAEPAKADAPAKDGAK